MSVSRAYMTLGVVASAALFFVYTFGGTSSASGSESPRTVRWLLAHQPADVYVRAVDVFADELARESGGTLALEAVTPAQLGFTSAPSHEQILGLLESGAVELSSTYGVANGMGDTRFWTWQLPFLFFDYDAVETAFNSSKGQELIDGFSERSPVRALAYTLSGGFRVLASAGKEIQTVGDLEGLRIATAGGPVAEAIWKSVGAIPVSVGQEDGAIGSEDVDAVETTYARLSSAVGSRGEYIQHIAETNHSLFLTTIVAGDTFYDSLSSAEQAALTAAARKAAAVERADAIALNAQTKERLQVEGSVITEFSSEERTAFKEAAQEVYLSFEEVFAR